MPGGMQINPEQKKATHEWLKGKFGESSVAFLMLRVADELRLDGADCRQMCQVREINSRYAGHSFCWTVFFGYKHDQVRNMRFLMRRRQTGW